MSLAFAMLCFNTVLWFFYFHFTDEIQQFFGSKGKREFVDINTALGIVDEANVDIKDDFILVSRCFPDSPLCYMFLLRIFVLQEMPGSTFERIIVAQQNRG